MPHVIVKLYTGRSRKTIEKLAEALAGDVARIAGCSEQSVSVAVEEYDPAEWAETVYRPDILEGAETLVRRPGYNPFAGST